MSFFDNIFGVGNSQGNPKGIKKIEQFCSQLGWRIAERSDRAIAIPFNLSIGQRHLVISVERTGQVGVMGMSSDIDILANQMHELAAPCLLARNHEMAFGAWKMEPDGNCFVFKVQGTFTVDGLSLQIFKSYCEGLAAEVGASINYMRNKGWL